MLLDPILTCVTRDCAGLREMWSRCVARANELGGKGSVKLAIPTVKVERDLGFCRRRTLRSVFVTKAALEVSAVSYGAFRDLIYGGLREERFSFLFGTGGKLPVFNSPLGTRAPRAWLLRGQSPRSFSVSSLI